MRGGSRCVCNLYFHFDLGGYINIHGFEETVRSDPFSVMIRATWNVDG
ncbi:hypothetical protein DAI22_01g292450 [Oryza sativa Japonica Group]|nr:hypothetical protein DAI22_01g292450 [Oryza sativa Japonica Group]